MRIYMNVYMMVLRGYIPTFRYYIYTYIYIYTYTYIYTIIIEGRQDYAMSSSDGLPLRQVWEWGQKEGNETCRKIGTSRNIYVF